MTERRSNFSIDAILSRKTVATFPEVCQEVFKAENVSKHPSSIKCSVSQSRYGSVSQSDDTLYKSSLVKTDSRCNDRNGSPNRTGDFVNRYQTFDEAEKQRTQGRGGETAEVMVANVSRWIDLENVKMLNV